MKELQVKKTINQNVSMPINVRTKLVELSKELDMPLSHIILGALRDKYKELREPLSA